MVADEACIIIQYEVSLKASYALTVYDIRDRLWYARQRYRHTCMSVDRKE